MLENLDFLRVSQALLWLRRLMIQNHSNLGEAYSII